MSIEATVVCDSCARIIVAADSAAKARQENREMGGFSRSPRDYCAACHNPPPPEGFERRGDHLVRKAAS